MIHTVNVSMIYRHHCMMQCWLKTKRPTCSIKHGQQNGGNPCSVTVSNAKFPDEFFEEDTDCLWKGVGESCDDKTAEKDSPAPASIGSFDARWTIINYHCSHDAAQEGSLRNKTKISWYTLGQLLSQTGRTCTTAEVTDYFRRKELVSKPGIFVIRHW